ncbi:MAG TPA: hypothetical protein VND65_23240 [Candidatus Binatia bacterium]|nr:hypothetical protein [Candidatus Binatia bacterium]
MALATLFIPRLSSAQDIRSGEDLLRAMHDRYTKTWYDTVTFTQKSTTYNPDGTTKVETWYEALWAPGRLRIDIGAPAESNGPLLIDGKLTVFKAGKQTGERPYVNMLLVLGFDVYKQAPETTAQVARSEGYDLSKIHEDTWEGQPVYVVGAEKGDLKTKQFWVEKDRLLFVRIFEVGRQDPTKIQDVRFEDYREVKGGWLSEKVAVINEGKQVFGEEYSDIQINPKLNPAVFDPAQYGTVRWEK